MKFAAALADQKDERKPIVLVISEGLLLSSSLAGRSLGEGGFLLTSLARRLVTPKFKRRRKPRAKAAAFLLPPHFTLRSNRFSLRGFAAENVKFRRHPICR